jgi:type IV pilus assembly protein PilC
MTIELKSRVSRRERSAAKPKKEGKSRRHVKYQFKATDASGAIVKGVETALTSGAVHATLIGRGLQPTEVRPKRNPLKFEITKKKVPRKDIANFSRQLAVFMKAGVPIMEALEIISKETQNKIMDNTLQGIVASLRAGQTFADSAAAHPKAFPPFYVAVLRSAELTGSLDHVLIQLSKHVDRETKARSRITSALVYPMIVTAMGVATVIILSVFVLPRFVVFFKSLHAKLPFATRLMINGSSFTTKWSLEIVILVVAVIAGFITMRRMKGGRAVLDRIVLRLPIVGAITQASIFERSFRVMGAMLRAGVDMPLAMVVTAESANNAVFRKAYEGIRAAMMEGQGLAGPIERTGLFPETARQMLRVGEETGTLDQQLEAAAEYYGQELEIKIDRATSMFEPAMIIGVGIVVGFVAVALISAMYGIYGQVKVG